MPMDSLGVHSNILKFFTHDISALFSNSYSLGYHDLSNKYLFPLCKSFVCCYVFEIPYAYFGICAGNLSPFFNCPRQKGETIILKQGILHFSVSPSYVLGFMLSSMHPL